MAGRRESRRGWVRGVVPELGSSKGASNSVGKPLAGARQGPVEPPPGLSLSRAPASGNPRGRGPSNDVSGRARRSRGQRKPRRAYSESMVGTAASPTAAGLRVGHPEVVDIRAATRCARAISIVASSDPRLRAHSRRSVPRPRDPQASPRPHHPLPVRLPARTTNFRLCSYRRVALVSTLSRVIDDPRPSRRWNAMAAARRPTCNSGDGDLVRNAANSKHLRAWSSEDHHKDMPASIKMLYGASRAGQARNTLDDRAGRWI